MVSPIRSRFAIPIQKLALCLLLVWPLSGCATHIQPASPRPPIPTNPATGDEPVAIDPTIEDLPEALGFNLFTLFAIPIGRIHLNPNLATPRIVEGLELALERAGRVPVDPAEHPEAPRLVARVDRLRFHAYLWFLPAKVVWGRLALSIALMDPDGATRWQRTYEVRDREVGFGRVVDDVVNGAFHETIAHAARDFASDEFGAACRARAESAAREVEPVDVAAAP